MAQGLALLTIGYSLLEGIGSALMIPPIYILITVCSPTRRPGRSAFGVVSGAAGLGSAAGPLIGGLITSYISWRASFLLQVAGGRRDRLPAAAHRRPAAGRASAGLRPLGAVLSAIGLFFVVFGVLQRAPTDGAPRRRP